MISRISFGSASLLLAVTASAFAADGGSTVKPRDMLTLEDPTFLLADVPTSGTGAESDEDLAKKLANPVASLISVPFQFNYDRGYDGPAGDEEGSRITLNIQPVVPVSLNDDWTLIIRTIVPLIDQDDLVIDGDSTQFGLGDTTQSFFFSPKKPGPGGAILGFGPALLWPTATNDSLGSEKWAIGPTGLILFQKGPWTYGVLANHLWSYAGDDDRGEVNATFVQPFLSYTTKSAFTVGINAESTYDWSDDQWTVPINVFASQLTKLGDQRVSIGGGVRYYAEAPEGGPDWGFRIIVTLLFPE